MEKEDNAFSDDFLRIFLSADDAKCIYKIQKEFLESYVAAIDEMSVEDWLQQELQKQLHEKSYKEIQEISEDILTSLKISEEMKRSQQVATERGRSKESWLASKLIESTSYMSTQESYKYLQGIDDALSKANAAMHKTITTKGSGYSVASLNPNLDGFIAEQHHVNSFNINAAAKGSGLRAEVQALKPGDTYTKNGFDVIIKDASGKRIHQYQMKYGSTAEDTIRMIKAGNYNNQTLVVPTEQVEAVQKAFPNKTVTDKISDGNIHSNALTKNKAKHLQEDAQNGFSLDSDWSQVSNKALALGICEQVGKACLFGVVVGTGIDVSTKLFKNEPIDGKEVLETAIVSGADFGIKVATAGALKVAVEKNLIGILPKDTSGNMYSAIAFIAVENAKIAIKIAKGDLTLIEGIDAMQQTTGASLAGLIATEKGAEIGAAIGSVFGLVGMTIGAFVGGSIGYMAGSELGKAVVIGVQKARDKAVEVVKSIGNGIKEKAKVFLKRRIFG